MLCAAQTKPFSDAAQALAWLFGMPVQHCAGTFSAFARHRICDQQRIRAAACACLLADILASGRPRTRLIAEGNVEAIFRTTRLKAFKGDL